MEDPMSFACRCFAVATAFLAGGIAAANALPYQVAQAATSCNGTDSCTIVFPAILAGETAIIGHVSCNYLTSDYHNAYLATLSALSAPTVVDSLPVQQYAENTGGVLQGVVAAPTLFYVNGGDSAVIAIAAIGPFTGEPACFLSGTLIVNAIGHK
jgi:hypothetical protein